MAEEKSWSVVEWAKKDPQKWISVITFTKKSDALDCFMDGVAQIREYPEVKVIKQEFDEHGNGYFETESGVLWMVESESRNSYVPLTEEESNMLFSKEEIVKSGLMTESEVNAIIESKKEEM